MATFTYSKDYPKLHYFAGLIDLVVHSGTVDAITGDVIIEADGRYPGVFCTTPTAAAPPIDPSQ
jgi:hypothetical protein